MGKIAPVSAKYIIYAQIQIDGVVDRPDVIGAVFGQTEGLLGADLELRELQRSGRIGRIEVKTDTKSGKTSGEIIIPSSLDKSETAIVAAALETIQRIGPCNSNVKVDKIEDVRISKRSFVIDRAKELLKELTSNVLPDSQEITEEVAQSVRMMEITEYGKDRLPAGPSIDDTDEIIIVEGRADVLNLLKNGIKNVIALNGTNVPDTIIELGRRKVITLFIDGDRGGDLILKELSSLTEVDFVAKAPDGKEVEEITKKEIHKALRSKVAVEQAKMEINGKGDLKEEKKDRSSKPSYTQKETRKDSYHKQRDGRYYNQGRRISLTSSQRESFKNMLDDLMGTRGAYILDEHLNILGKVPSIELASTIRSLKSVFAIVLDGVITSDISSMADKSGVKFLVAVSSKVKPVNTKAQIITSF
jgi:DNA primase